MKQNRFLEDIYTNGGFSLVPSYDMNYAIKNVNNTESIFEIQYAVNRWFYPQIGAMADGICGPQFIGSSGFFSTIP